MDGHTASTMKDALFLSRDRLHLSQHHCYTVIDSQNKTCEVFKVSDTLCLMVILFLLPYQTPLSTLQHHHEPQDGPLGVSCPACHVLKPRWGTRTLLFGMVEILCDEDTHNFLCRNGQSRWRAEQGFQDPGVNCPATRTLVAEKTRASVQTAEKQPHFVQRQQRGSVQWHQKGTKLVAERTQFNKNVTQKTNRLRWY